MRHTVQRGYLEKEFRRLLRKGAGAQRRSKDGLVAKEGRLGQTAPMIARILFQRRRPLRRIARRFSSRCQGAPAQLPCCQILASRRGGITAGAPPPASASENFRLS